MLRLSHADQDALLEALREVYSQTELAPLRERMVRAATRLVPGDWGTFNEWQRVSLRIKSSISFPDVSAVSRPHFAAFRAYFHQHPIARANSATGCIHAQKISDYATLSQLQGTDLYNEYYHYIGLRHQFTFSVSDDDSMQRWIAVNRGRRDFSERDRTVLNLLQPHYAQAFQNVSRLARMQLAVNAAERAQEAQGEAMLVVDGAARIEWLSSTSRRWLRECLGIDVGECSKLPEVVGRWLGQQRENLRAEKLLGGASSPLRLTGARGVLMLRCAAHDASGNATLLLRWEQSAAATPACALPELTRRENEVLGWIAHGKSNPDIATILGLSVRTIYKHVENIFGKLNVENRGAAMLRALNATRRE